MDKSGEKKKINLLRFLAFYPMLSRGPQNFVPHSWYSGTSSPKTKMQDVRLKKKSVLNSKQKLTLAGAYFQQRWISSRPSIPERALHTPQLHLSDVHKNEFSSGPQRRRGGKNTLFPFVLSTLVDFTKLWLFSFLDTNWTGTRSLIV